MIYSILRPDQEISLGRRERIGSGFAGISVGGGGWALSGRAARASVVRYILRSDRGISRDVGEGTLVAGSGFAGMRSGEPERVVDCDV